MPDKLYKTTRKILNIIERESIGKDYISLTSVKIAEELDISPRTVITNIQILEELGYIRCEYPQKSYRKIFLK